MVRIGALAVTVLAFLVWPHSSVALEDWYQRDSSTPAATSVSSPHDFLAQADQGARAQSPTSTAEWWWISVSGDAIVFSGRRNFIFGANSPPFTGVFDKKVEHNLDGTGPGGSGTVGLSLTDRLRIEATISGAGASSTTKAKCSGSFLWIPAIVAPGAALAFCPTLSVPSDPQASELHYSQSILESSVDLLVRVWQRPQSGSTLDALLGVGYFRLSQEFDQRSQLDVNQTERLHMTITDNAAGARLGLKGEHPLLSSLRVEGSIVGGIYHRWSTLEARQDFNNVFLVVGAGGIPFVTQKLTRFDSDEGFVPRLEAGVALSYDITATWSVGIFYRFDGMWNLSNPDTPRFEQAFVTECCTNNDLRLRGNDHLFSQRAGLRIIGRF